MKNIFFFLIYLITLCACQHTPPASKERDFVKKTYYNSRISVSSGNLPLDSLQFYFPEMVNDDYISRYTSKKGYTRTVVYTKHTNSIDSFRNAWYSKNLYALKEPLLFNKPFNKEIIRFTWLRSFHNPIAIRAEKDGQNIDLYWKLCDGVGGYEPGTLVLNKTKGINIEQWNEILRLLDKVPFWTPQYQKEEPTTDGARWIIEATGADYYQVMDIQNGGRLFPVGRYMLSLTDIVISKKSEIY